MGLEVRSLNPCKEGRRAGMDTQARNPNAVGVPTGRVWHLLAAYSPNTLKWKQENPPKLQTALGHTARSTWTMG